MRNGGGKEGDVEESLEEKEEGKEVKVKAGDRSGKDKKVGGEREIRR